MAEAKHSLDPVRDALREYEEAVRAEVKRLVGSKVMERQETARARQRVLDEIIELVRKTKQEWEAGKG